MNMYNANVRTGNWFNELMLQEAKTKQYLRKNKNGELKVQKARHLLVELLTEIPLTFPVVGLSYGAIIEIVSPENPPNFMYKVKEKQGLALACNIEYPNSDKRSSFAAGDPVLATGLLTPCRRNVWTLIPEDKSLKGKELRFGEMFHIQLVGSEEPLYVHAPAYKPGIKTGESTHIVPKLLPWTNDLTRFMVVHYNPKLRCEAEGTVVPPFEKIGIVQVSTTEALAVETEFWSPTYFGMECEVSVHTFKDVQNSKKPDPRNFWSFLLATP